MKNPKDKAKELISMFKNNLDMDGDGIARECAKVHVTQILELFEDNRYDSRYIYYDQVKLNILML